MNIEYSMDISFNNIHRYMSWIQGYINEVANIILKKMYINEMVTVVIY